MPVRPTRRSFMKGGIAAGIAIKISFIGSGTHAATLVDSLSQPSPSWLDQNGRPRFRLDAMAKVTGQKIFSRDFRATDMLGWPKEQSHAFLIHAKRADRTFEGIDLSGLASDLQPDRLVLAEDLARDGIKVPAEGFYGDIFLVSKGQTPQLLGQPVAQPSGSCTLIKTSCDTAQKPVPSRPRIMAPCAMCASRERHRRAMTSTRRFSTR
jgi:hypothetical protein